jgi:hypothetical protein
MPKVLELCTVCQSVVCMGKSEDACEYHANCRDLYNSARDRCPLRTLAWDCTVHCDALRDLEEYSYLDSIKIEVQILQSPPFMFHFTISSVDSEERADFCIDKRDEIRVGNIFILPVNDM